MCCLPFGSARLFVLAMCLPGAVAVIPEAVAQTDSSRATTIEEENRQPGSTDWQLTRVRADAEDIRSPWIEGYCSRQSVAAGETIDIMVSTNPPQSFQIEIFRMGYYGGCGARLMQTLGPLEGTPQPTPAARRKEPARMPMGTAHPADDSRTIGSAACTSADSRRCPATEPAVLAELCGLHRPRPAAGRHPVSVLRQHLAGV